MKSKFGKKYRLEFCTDFFSYSSQTSSWCLMVADPTVGKYMVGCLTNLTVLLVFVCERKQEIHNSCYKNFKYALCGWFVVVCLSGG